MSYKVNDAIKVLEELFPLENAMEYDNPGLLTGSRDQDLNGIFLTLDCTSDPVKIAKEKGLNMIIAHHPLIFGGIDNVCFDNSTGRILSGLIKNDIALYACHTQLDCTEEFGNLAICDAIGYKGAPLEGATIGSVFDTDTTLGVIAAEAVKGLDASGAITLSSKEEKVKRVFVQGGAFDEDNISLLMKSGVDLVITGEMKHHHMVFLMENGISTLLLGHNATERIYLPKLKRVLEGRLNDLPIFVDFGKERTLL